MFDNIITFFSLHTPLLYLSQSLWRDEAFSVLVAEPGGLETIRITASDFNPPLYYLLLHYWIKIFGESEMAIRMLSFIFFLAFLYVFYQFAKQLFKGIWAQIALLLALVNPMLLYYSFEARMYSLYAFTTTASMYFFFVKKWKLYLIFTTLALYTHPFTVFIPLTQGIYLLITKKLTVKTLKWFLIPFIFYLPWILVIIQQLKRSGQMWIYPLNFNLIFSVLGNLFTGYEGTPGNLWTLMKILSLIFMVIFIFAALARKNFRKNLLFLLWVFLPLCLVLGISYFKPIYVNRYLITVSVAQLILLILGITSLPGKKIKIISTILLFSFSVFMLLYLPRYIKKVDIRHTFFLVNNLTRNNDLVFARSPLVFFESLYYFSDRSRVYLYNPDNVVMPQYLGSIFMPVEKNVAAYPKYPQRAFMIYENGNYAIFSDFQK